MRFVAITQADVNNGNGCRTTLWIAGCNHHCPGCHNSWTWDYNQGKHWADIKDRLYKNLSKPYIKGLTLSGGDPLDQSPDDLEDLICILSTIRKDFPDKDIWLYTGYVYEDLNDLQRKVLEKVDVLIDGPYIQEQRDITLPFRGSKNQRILYMKDLQ